MSLPYKYCAVSMSDLLLDVKNPRFASSTLVDNVSKMPEQSDVINHLLKYADIITLAKNINRTQCLHGSEMITCYENKDGKLVVAEGNRRVCACKLLLNRDLIPDEYKANFPEASPATIENIKVITINLYPDKQSVQSYLSDRHITGVRKWSALEKNNYYMNLFQQHGDIHIVKTFTSDTLATVKNCIIKYQFFMKVFKVLKQNGKELEIEKIDYLPLVDRFMNVLVGNDSEVGLSLKLDQDKLVYLCPDNKKELYERILLLVGEAFLSNKTIVGTDVPNKVAQKKLIIDNVKIPGLYELIKEFKAIDADGTYTSEEDEAPPQEEGSNAAEGKFEYFIPDKFIPKKERTDTLYISAEEATDFAISGKDYDIKICEIIRELATLRVSMKPVACACLYRCLLEMCARRVFDKHVNPSVKAYDESSLASNLIYVTDNVIGNMFTDAESRKQQKAIKTLLSKMGIVDTLNLYIHFPDMVDISLILHTWNTMKLFVIKCLKI